jgi:ABC-2 type transport system permease protein
LLLNFAIGYLAAQSLFLTLHYYGVTQSRTALHYAFSGLAAPLALFPPGLKSAASALPFRHVIETPVLIGLGMVPRAAVPGLLLQQVAWAGGLLALAAVLFQEWFKRHQLQGG